MICLTYTIHEIRIQLKRTVGMHIACVMKFCILRWAATATFLIWVPLSWVYLVELEVTISNLFSEMPKSDAPPRPVTM